MRRRGNPQIIIGAVAGIVIIALLVFGGSKMFSSKPKDIVSKFYKYEQRMDFTHAYDLFHPLMQENFSREWYFSERHRIFFDHFDVDTFQYTVGKGTKLSEWQMSEDSPVLEDVYRYPVTKTYRSARFGNFSIHQDVFTAKDEDGSWKLLWSYH